MNERKQNPRREYRVRENERVLESATLEAAFPEVKALTVVLTHYDYNGSRKSGDIKYRVDLAHAKSVFRFNCANRECVEGDFDLSRELAQAIAGRSESVNGELRCQGWRTHSLIGTVRCDDLLRFELLIDY